jgi:hypothetical protein
LIEKIGEEGESQCTKPKVLPMTRYDLVNVAISLLDNIECNSDPTVHDLGMYPHPFIMHHSRGFYILENT